MSHLAYPRFYAIIRLKCNFFQIIDFYCYLNRLKPTAKQEQDVKQGKEYSQESSELVTQCKLSYTMIDSREKAMQEERLEQRTDVVIKSNTILCPGDYKDLLKV